jgi:hypothetical protein
MNMDWSFGVLLIAIALSALGLLLDRNGRRADRGRRIHHR